MLAGCLWVAPAAGGALMLAQGVSIKELAALLGHASEAFTLRTYVHLMPNSYDRARLAMNEMFKPRKIESTKDEAG